MMSGRHFWHGIRWPVWRASGFWCCWPWGISLACISAHVALIAPSRTPHAWTSLEAMQLQLVASLAGLMRCTGPSNVKRVALCTCIRSCLFNATTNTPLCLNSCAWMQSTASKCFGATPPTQHMSGALSTASPWTGKRKRMTSKLNGRNTRTASWWSVGLHTNGMATWHLTTGKRHIWKMMLKACRSANSTTFICQALMESGSHWTIAEMPKTRRSARVAFHEMIGSLTNFCSSAQGWPKTWTCHARENEPWSDCHGALATMPLWMGTIQPFWRACAASETFKSPIGSQSRPTPIAADYAVVTAIRNCQSGSWQRMPRSTKQHKLAMRQTIRTSGWPLQCTRWRNGWRHRASSSKNWRVRSLGILERGWQREWSPIAMQGAFAVAQ